MLPKWPWLAALVLCSGAFAARPVHWQFRADFHHGFNGWMSYPPPQDIGFDPTLSVEQSPVGPVLIREVIGAGERELSTGFIRPLHFLASGGTKFHLRYVAAWPSPGAGLKLLLAGENGRRYEAPLPASGAREITLAGTQLHLPATPVEIEAIALVGDSEQPASGARNRLELQDLQVDALRPAETPLLSPALLADPDRLRVAAEVVDSSAGLALELGAGPSPVRVVLKDAEGRITANASVTAPGLHVIALGGDARPGLWTAHLETADARTDFSFLVLGSIAPHPRVLLSADRLARLRIAPEFASMRMQIHEQASTQMAKLKDAATAGAEIAGLPAGRTLRPSFDGELTSYFQLVEAYSNAIASSALDYALTADQGSLEAARRDLLAVARWPTWTPNRFASHGMHTYYETGIFTQRLALAYDLLAGKLTAAEKQEIARAFRTKCIEPAIDEYFRYNRMPTGASNWMANSLGGALAAAVAIAGDVPDWRTREGAALAPLLAAYQQNLSGLFPGDGSEMEPAGYEHFAMEGLSWGAAALRSLQIRPVGMADMLAAFWLPDYSMVRPNLALDMGDFNGEFRTLDGFAFGAEFSGIPALRAFYDRAEKKGPISPLDLVCCTDPPSPPGGAPLSRVFDKRGSAVLRSGWDPGATVISLRAGPWFNHEHHDQGSFQVAAFGARVISEAGYANYYLDPNYPGYFTQAPGHNTVLVDEDAFSQGGYGGVFWSALRTHPVITEQLLSARFDYLEADLAPAYGDRLPGYRRKYLFLAPDVLIVRDDLRAAQPHVFTWLLHAAQGAAVETRGSRALIRTAGAEAAVTSANPAAVWEVRPTPLPSSTPQYLGNVLLDLKHETDARRRSVLRLSSPRSATATFQVAMQFRKSSAASSDLRPVAISNASGFEGDASGVWALFREGPGELRFRDMACDGSVFAGRGEEEWIAIGTRIVSERGQPLFTASAAVHAAWKHTPAGIEIDLQLEAPTVVSVHAAGQVASSVTVDGTAVQYKARQGTLELPSLPKGEHRVRISTRAAV